MVVQAGEVGFTLSFLFKHPKLARGPEGPDSFVQIHTEPGGEPERGLEWL